jgi:NitT/TauT family transport system substrate-binding protein
MLSGDKIYSLDDNRQLFGNSRAPGPAYQSMKAVIDFALESKLIKKAPEAESLLDPALLE